MNEPIRTGTISLRISARHRPQPSVGKVAALLASFDFSLDRYDICETRDAIRLAWIAGNQTLPEEIVARGRLLAAD